MFAEIATIILLPVCSVTWELFHQEVQSVSLLLESGLTSRLALTNRMWQR